MDREQREEEMIAGFSEITSSTAESSRFFLESANWNLELALANFYEGGYPAIQDLASGDHIGNPLVPTVQLEDRPIEEDPALHRGSGDARPINPSHVSPPSIPLPSRPRFASISTMRAQDSSSDEEEGQAYYAGGSEHSGQQVVGPPRSPNDLISDLFRSLRDQGGIEAISHEPGGPQLFSGQGYRLGHATTDANSRNRENITNENRPGGQREIILRLWRDGFSVNGGQLRSYNDPVEREFLSRISRGHVPAELFSQAEGGAVHLSLEDRRHENFIPSATRQTFFTGRGHVLGSAASDIGVDRREDEIETTAPPDQPTIPRSIVVDHSSPTTTVQIRLPEGDRIQITLNQSHTIGDLRTAIIELRPMLSGVNFTLTTMFPNNNINSNSLTLKEADLLNTSLLLRPQ